MDVRERELTAAPRVILAGGDHLGVLAAARALRAGGYEPWAVVRDLPTYASTSRSMGGSVAVGHPEHSGEFAEAVGALAVSRAAVAVLPGTEPALAALSRHPDAVPAAVAVASATDEAIDLLTNKVHLPDLAGRVGLGSPPTWIIESGDSLAHVALPAVVKPVRSWRETDSGWVRVNAAYAENPAELRAAVDRMPSKRAVVQPFVAGRLLGVAGVVWDGDVVAVVQMEAARTWPVPCGTFSYARTTPLDPALGDQVAAVFAKAGWSGIFHADLLATPGGPLLIDVNPRVFTSLALPVGAGCNLPAIWVDLLLGRTGRASGYAPGVRYRLGKDDYRAIAIHARRHPLAALGASLPRPRTVHPVLRAGDPGPVMVDVRRAVRRLRTRDDVPIRPGRRGRWSPAGAGPDVVTSDISALEERWEDLADRTAAPPFLRPGWVAAWWDAFGAGRLDVVGVGSGGDLDALVPLHRPGRRSPAHRTEPFPLTARPRTLRAAANWHSPKAGFLAADGRSSAALAAALFDLAPTVLSLGFFDAPGLEDTREAAIRAGYRLAEVPLPPSPHVDVRGEWAAFHQENVSTKVASDLRRRRRRLAEIGAVSVDVSDGTAALQTSLDEGFRLEASGWKSARRSAIASRNATRRFYGSVARWAADRGILRLAFLRVDGRAVAFQFALEDVGAYYFIKGGYDPAFERFAPGRLLVDSMLARAFAAGLDRFDFLGGDERWKMEWASSTSPRTVVHAFAPTAAGRAEEVVLRYGRPGRARARAVARSVLRAGRR